MPRSITRRTFLRSAGGVTFLALVPVGPGLFAAATPEAGTRLPLFTTRRSTSATNTTTFTDNPAKWTHADDGHADYVVKMITDRHSLSVFDVEGTRLTLTQVDEAGQEIDRMIVTEERREAPTPP